MASFKDRAKARIDRIRARHRFVDHLFATVTHYGTVNGNAQAGAVTFFGFLSFFPILALAFFVIGYISRVYPDAQDQLVTALGEVLPGVVGEGPGEISLATFEENASAIGIIGLVGVLYSGLGWLSGMRDALEVMFLLPKKEQPNFFLGKARDLMVLAVIGFVLIVSVALSGAISGFSEQILALVELEDSFLAAALLWLLGAVGFEVLKSLAAYLIASTKDQPAFQAFGVALILVVWINYFSRLVMYGAAWAYTSPLNDREAAVAATGGIPRPVGVPAAADDGGARKRLVAAGAAAALVVGGVIARRRSGRMVS